MGVMFTPIFSLPVIATRTNLSLEEMSCCFTIIPVTIVSDTLSIATAFRVREERPATPIIKIDRSRVVNLDFKLIGRFDHFPG